MLWNGGGLGTGESNVSIVLLNSVLHRSSSLSDVHLSAFTGNPVNYAILFSRSTASFGRTNWDLPHLNNQQPSIRFTMQTEKDNKLSFLNTAVLREPDGRLTTSVYRKPTHTDQNLAYDSHHPQSVKRGLVKCLYECAKRLVTKPSVIFEEKIMVILLLSCRNLPRPKNQTTVPSPPMSSKVLRFYLMSKVCPNSFAVSYNNKAYALFSSRRLC